ncbi:MAG: pilus assembly protein N-terminal domain-containing protein [Alphaproteobacteria bacterium]|nr:pilus assembly protein N-terminal domain-containing protein [Alphaproteobacteria bacterium]
MRRSILFAATALIACASIPASAAGTAVPLDEVRMIVFKKPVSTLYVGNPLIADVTMIDKRHAFVQGKAFGTTNIIALDADGRQVSNSRIVVAGGGPAVVTLQRGASQTTYSCAASRCDVTPTPGDGKDSYDSQLEQISKHQSMLAKAATDGQ